VGSNLRADYPRFGVKIARRCTSISVVDEADRTIWRGRSQSTPDDIAEKLSARAPHAVRIGLECGQLSNWLYAGLKAKGLPVICIDARTPAPRCL
jgi:transposase